MRTEVLGLVLAVLVIASLSVGYLGGVYNGRISTATVTSVSTSTATTAITSEITSTTTQTYSSSPVQGCATKYSPSIIEGTESNSSWIVFDANSTAWVCVEISDNFNASISWDHPPSVWMVENGTWASPTNVTVTVSPPTIQLSPNSVSWYVFEIVPLSGTRAIYNIGLPHPCWSKYFLVAEGYSVNQLQNSELNIPEIVTSCPAGNGYTTIVGITNLTPTYSA